MRDKTYQRDIQTNNYDKKQTDNNVKWYNRNMTKIQTTVSNTQHRKTIE